MRASRRMRWKRVISWFETRDVASLLTMRSVHRCYQAAQCRNRLCPCHPKPKAQDGGDRGIRTLDRALQPYNGLANRRLQPLGHISVALDMPDTMASRKRQMRAKSCSLRLLRVLPPNLRNGGGDPRLHSGQASRAGRQPRRKSGEIPSQTVDSYGYGWPRLPPQFPVCLIRFVPIHPACSLAPARMSHNGNKTGNCRSKKFLIKNNGLRGCLDHDCVLFVQHRSKNGNTGTILRRSFVACS